MGIQNVIGFISVNILSYSLQVFLNIPIIYNYLYYRVLIFDINFRHINVRIITSHIKTNN